jgi:hypothetical protein
MDGSGIILSALNFTVPLWQQLKSPGKYTGALRAITCMIKY